MLSQEEKKPEGLTRLAQKMLLRLCSVMAEGGSPCAPFSSTMLLLTKGPVLRTTVLFHSLAKSSSHKGPVHQLPTQALKRSQTGGGGSV